MGMYGATAVPASNTPTANVGQFGWTTNDVTSIKDIITYVQTAMDAAARAEAAAQTAENDLDRIEQINREYAVYVQEIYDMHADMTALVQTVNVTSDDIKAMETHVANMEVSVTSTSQHVDTVAAQVLSNALQAVYKFVDRNAESTSFIIDIAGGSVQKVKLNFPSTTLSFQVQTDPTNISRQLTLFLKQGTGSNKVVWPSTVSWSYNRPPILSYEKDKTDIVTLFTFDSGATWVGVYNGGWINA